MAAGRARPVTARSAARAEEKRTGQENSSGLLFQQQQGQRSTGTWSCDCCGFRWVSSDTPARAEPRGARAAQGGGLLHKIYSTCGDAAQCAERRRGLRRGVRLASSGLHAGPMKTGAAGRDAAAVQQAGTASAVRRERCTEGVTVGRPGQATTRHLLTRSTSLLIPIVPLLATRGGTSHSNPA